MGWFTGFLGRAGGVALAVWMGGAIALAQAPASQQVLAPIVPVQNPTLADSMNAIKQAIPLINTSLVSTRPQKWKVKADEHVADERNYLSIHHDLEDVLPNLIKAAQASPHSIAQAIAVYRNLNALYDVVVRLQQTAALTGKEDAPLLQDVLTRLEALRGMMAEKMITLAGQQEQALAQAQKTLADQAAAAAAPKKIVADDNPPRKRRPAGSKTAPSKTTRPAAGTSAKPAAAKPAAGQWTEGKSADSPQ
jgi:hypothetical protein